MAFANERATEMTLGPLAWEMYLDIMSWDQTKNITMYDEITAQLIRDEDTLREVLGYAYVNPDLLVIHGGYAQKDQSLLGNIQTAIERTSDHIEEFQSWARSEIVDQRYSVWGRAVQYFTVIRRHEPSSFKIEELERQYITIKSQGKSAAYPLSGNAIYDTITEGLQLGFLEAYLETQISPPPNRDHVQRPLL